MLGGSVDQHGLMWAEVIPDVLNETVLRQRISSADEEAALAAAGTCRSCLRPDADIDAAGLCANCAGARDRIRAEIRRGSNARHLEMVRLGPGGTA
jgi:hypothetical protein